MPRICPDCKLPMGQRSFFGVMLDACEHCAGIFFDDGEICEVKERGGERAFDELDHMVQPEPGHVYGDRNLQRNCPSCANLMHQFRYMYSSPVVLDSCENCGGVFIENGELQQMREYLESVKDGSDKKFAEASNQAAKLEAMNALERARAQRARIAAAMIAYHKES